MIPAWSVVLVALAYLCGLFAVAHSADTSGRRLMTGRARTTIYALALGVYCTSWTFYGSVGFANLAGFDFLGIYVGPILVIGLIACGLPSVRELDRAPELVADSSP